MAVLLTLNSKNMDNKEKAFDFAAESTKQLITLSTAIIALTVTFSKDVIGAINPVAKHLLSFSWVAFILSIVFGVWTMLSLTGTLDPMQQSSAASSTNASQQNTSINGKNIRLPSILQILLFLIGLILSIVFGCNSLNSKQPQDVNGYKVLRQTRFGSDTTVYKDTIIIPIK